MKWEKFTEPRKPLTHKNNFVIYQINLIGLCVTDPDCIAELLRFYRIHISIHNMNSKLYSKCIQYYAFNNIYYTYIDFEVHQLNALFKFKVISSKKYSQIIFVSFKLNSRRSSYLSKDRQGMLFHPQNICWNNVIR